LYSIIKKTLQGKGGAFVANHSKSAQTSKKNSY